MADMEDPMVNDLDMTIYLESLFPQETPKLKLTTAAKSCLSQMGSLLGLD